MAMDTLHTTSQIRAPQTSQPRLLGARKAKPAPARLLSPALRIVLALAAALTLGFAVFSAVALHAEPTLRVELEPEPVRAAAPQAPKSPEAVRPSARRADAGATRSADYLPRARSLDRSH